MAGIVSGRDGDGVTTFGFKISSDTVFKLELIVINFKVINKRPYQRITNGISSVFIVR